MTASGNTLGLIAGQGRLPFIVAAGAKKENLKVVCVGLAGSVDDHLAKVVDEFYTVPLARPGTWIKKLRKNGADRTIMVGRVAKTRLYTPWKILKYLPDLKALKIYYWTLKHKNKQTDTILGALADELAKGGIILEDSTMYCKDHMASLGTMTKSKPSPSIQEDIEFGWEKAKALGLLDIGQTIAVKEKEVIAVEAIEGTAKMIERAGRLCKKGGWTLIKTAKPNQDKRFDVPCIGPDTIQSLHENNGKYIVLEADKTIIIDKPQTLALADKLGITIIGHTQ